MTRRRSHQGGVAVPTTPNTSQSEQRAVTSVVITILHDDGTQSDDTFHLEFAGKLPPPELKAKLEQYLFDSFYAACGRVAEAWNEARALTRDADIPRD